MPACLSSGARPMQNEHSYAYSSCVAAHFELKSRRFSHLKLLFRCELRRKNHLNFPMGSPSGGPARNRWMSRHATGCCITAQHHRQPPTQSGIARRNDPTRASLPESIRAILSTQLENTNKPFHINDLQPTARIGYAPSISFFQPKRDLPTAPPRCRNPQSGES